MERGTFESEFDGALSQHNVAWPPFLFGFKNGFFSSLSAQFFLPLKRFERKLKT